MKSFNYKRYMTSAVWSQRRESYFSRYRRQCVACGTTAGQIDLHHITYARAPGNESDKDLVPLCAFDHAEVHRLVRTTSKGLRQATAAVTGGQRPWRVSERPVRKSKRKQHKSDRYKPLVSGFEQMRKELEAAGQGSIKTAPKNIRTRTRKKKKRR